MTNGRFSWLKLIKLKMKFATSSGVATMVDYGLYLILEHTLFSPVVSNLISGSVGMVVNFLLQKKFVFDLQRKMSTAFGMAMMVSLGGLAISTGIISALCYIPFFNHYQFITKMCATGIVFFYNFYMKRFVFEKKFV